MKHGISRPDIAAMVFRSLDIPKGCGDHRCVLRTPLGVAPTSRCKCSESELRVSAAKAEALRHDVSRLLEAIGERAPIDERAYWTARLNPGRKAELLSRWTPRHVFTLHAVPAFGQLAGRVVGEVMCVRRRVLSDAEECLIVETPSGTMHVDACDLAETGRARGWGNHRAGGPEKRPSSPSGLWGCDLALHVYDHLPTLEERTAWRRERAMEQALVSRPPTHVWVVLAGKGATSRMVHCPCSRALGYLAGDISRPDLNVELPGYEPPTHLRIIHHRLAVDFYELAARGSVKVERGEDGARAVFLRKPTASALRALE